MKLVAIGVGLAVGFGLAGTAQAQPLTPDYTQAPNGIGVTDPSITPAISPIQVPTAEVERGPDATTIVAHPYLAPWVHNLVPIAPNTAVEVQGAARITVPGAADGRALVVNPNGHCLFDGPGAQPAALGATALTPVRVDTPLFQLVIEPTLYR
ncbi:hypothetical protein F3087_17065 [Nocardia colli]|uniref:Uncharacterized protein n=1 Tax=Nocardia colli TaxID=2545717 RepID=A0A5N0EDB1_9NOCA|nr:hypothetical protein [Nocardia colli]KAA8887408.1 hypothetical protein F3087_17065 [Nocardia colli]